MLQARGHQGQLSTANLSYRLLEMGERNHAGLNEGGASDNPSPRTIANLPMALVATKSKTTFVDITALHAGQEISSPRRLRYIALKVDATTRIKKTSGPGALSSDYRRRIVIE